MISNQKSIFLVHIGYGVSTIIGLIKCAFKRKVDNQVIFVIYSLNFHKIISF
jgi:hypothetical protein